MEWTLVEDGAGVEIVVFDGVGDFNSHGIADSEYDAEAYVFCNANTGDTMVCVDGTRVEIGNMALA